MIRKILILLLIIAIFFGVKIIMKNNDNKKEENVISEERKIINVSGNEVTDGFTKKEENITKNVSNDISEKETRYLLKSDKGYISVYYLDEKNNEYLYKKTTIAVDYLSAKDIDDLEIGIEVKGKKELNKMLEDFE